MPTIRLNISERALSALRVHPFVIGRIMGTQPQIEIGNMVRVMQTDAMVKQELANRTFKVEGFLCDGTYAYGKIDDFQKIQAPISALMPVDSLKNLIRRHQHGIVQDQP